MINAERVGAKRTRLRDNLDCGEPFFMSRIAGPYQLTGNIIVANRSVQRRPSALAVEFDTILFISTVFNVTPAFGRKHYARDQLYGEHCSRHPSRLGGLKSTPNLIIEPCFATPLDSEMPVVARATDIQILVCQLIHAA